MRHSAWRHILRIAALAGFSGLVLTGCHSKPWHSAWLNPSATIQSNPNWWKLPAYRVDQFAGTIAIVNDSSALYVRLFSHDHRLARRLQMSGLTLWLSDAQNKNTPRLGIHYPMGMGNRRSAFHPDHFLPNADLAPEAMDEMISRQNGEFEILRGDSSLSGPILSDDAGKYGVTAVISDSAGGNFEYNVRIAYGDLAPWIKPGASILMAVESPAMKRPEGHGERSGGFGGGESPVGGWGGGRPGGGGFGGHGGGRGGRGGRGEERSDSTSQSGGITPDSPIKINFTVQLAASSASDSGDATTE